MNISNISSLGFKREIIFVIVKSYLRVNHKFSPYILLHRLIIPLKKRYAYLRELTINRKIG